MIDYGDRQFWYNAPTFGTVVGVYPLDPNDRRMYVDVLPHDHRGACIKAPVLHMPGSARQLRNKMTVLLLYVDGNPQYPVVLGHNFNIENISSLYADPLHPAHTNLDDHVFSHEETGVFARVRSQQSTATQGAPDGSPVVLDMIFNSGTKLQVSEYPPTGYTPPPATSSNPPPPPPDRVNMSLTLPSGLVVVADEPSTGQVSLAVQHPAGATVVIAPDGTMQLTSPTSITHAAPNHTVQAPASVPPAASIAVPAPAGGAQGISPTPTLPPGLQSFEAEVQHIVDAATKKISALTAQAQTVIDGIEGSITHAAQTIGLGGVGDTAVSLRSDPQNAALTVAHLKAFENNLWSQRLSDMKTLVAAMIAVSVPQSPLIIAQLATLLHIGLPSGSPVVNIRSS